jgi:kynureninase
MVHLSRAHQALGFEVRIVPREPDYSVRVERVVDAIDDTTVLVAVCHVLFLSSFVLDPAPIVEKAHRVGARVVLDTFQSAGIVPVDVTALGVDFAVGGCLKWLCGGPGNAFLYTSPAARAAVEPRFTGWIADRQPFAFDPSTHPRRDDAMGMMNGTPNIPAYHAAIPGLDIIRAVGVDRIRARSAAMTRRLLDHVDRLGLRTVASRDPERLAGTVALDVPDAPDVSRTLKARDFVVDYRPGVGIRVSPHFYNTDDEIDRLMAEVERIVRTRDYAAERHDSLVT